MFKNILKQKYLLLLILIAFCVSNAIFGGYFKLGLHNYQPGFQKNVSCDDYCFGECGESSRAENIALYCFLTFTVDALILLDQKSYNFASYGNVEKRRNSCQSNLVYPFSELTTNRGCLNTLYQLNSSYII